MLLELNAFHYKIYKNIMLVVDKCVVLLSSFKAGLKFWGDIKNIAVRRYVAISYGYKNLFNRIIAVRKMINIMF